MKKSISSGIIDTILWEKYSDRKEFPKIKSHLSKIRALSEFKLDLREKFQLNQDLKKIKEHKKREEVSLKRCDFLLLIRTKIDEGIEPQIKDRWATLKSSAQAKSFENWQEKMESRVKLMYTKAVGYDSDISGLLKFWTNLMKQNFHDDFYSSELLDELQNILGTDVNSNYNSPRPFDKIFLFLLEIKVKKSQFSINFTSYFDIFNICILYFLSNFRTPQNVVTPFDFGDAPVFDYVTRRSTSQDKTIGSVL